MEPHILFQTLVKLVESEVFSTGKTGTLGLPLENNQFCNIDWWALAMNCNSNSYDCASSPLALLHVMIDFGNDCITCKRR